MSNNKFVTYASFVESKARVEVEANRAKRILVVHPTKIEDKTLSLEEQSKAFNRLLDVLESQLRVIITRSVAHKYEKVEY